MKNAEQDVRCSEGMRYVFAALRKVNNLCLA